MKARRSNATGSGRDPKAPLTARELARMMGVSQSTISRAFTNGASISPTMRERVMQSAVRMGYKPNVIASILSRRKSDIVGVVVSDMQNPFYPALIERLAQGLQAAGRQCLLFSAPNGSDVSEQLALLRQYNVDALIVVSATLSSGTALKWAADGRTIVLINRTVSDAPVSSVCCDNASGAEAVADHFYALGHRKVAFVAGRPDTSTNTERDHAFTRRAAELGMTLAPRVSAGQYSYEAGFAAALQLTGKGIEAIFFANDILALGGLDALRHKAGLRVPEDISVVGFDDIAMANWPLYQLTTIRQPVDAMIEKAIQLMSGQTQSEPIVHRIAGELVVRATTQSR